MANTMKGDDVWVVFRKPYCADDTHILEFMLERMAVTT